MRTQLSLDEFAGLIRQRLNAQEILLAGLFSLLRAAQPEFWEPFITRLLEEADLQEAAGQSRTAEDIQKILQKHSPDARPTLAVIEGGKSRKPDALV